MQCPLIRWIVASESGENIPNAKVIQNLSAESQVLNNRDEFHDQNEENSKLS